MIVQHYPQRIHIIIPSTTTLSHYSPTCNCRASDNWPSARFRVSWPGCVCQMSPDAWYPDIPWHGLIPLVSAHRLRGQGWSKIKPFGWACMQRGHKYWRSHRYDGISQPAHIGPANQGPGSGPGTNQRRDKLPALARQRSEIRPAQAVTRPDTAHNAR